MVPSPDQDPNSQTDPSLTKASAPSTEKRERLFEDLLSRNLHNTTGYSRNSRFFYQLQLLGSDDGPELMLQADCDPDNRRMLDKVYLISHADMSQVSTEEFHDETSAGDYSRRRHIPTDHGFEYTEIYAKSPAADGEFHESFKVNCSSIPSE